MVLVSLALSPEGRCLGDNREAGMKVMYEEMTSCWQSMADDGLLDSFEVRGSSRSTQLSRTSRHSGWTHSERGDESHRSALVWPCIAVGLLR